MIKKYSKKSGEYFNHGFCCAESVLIAVSKNYEIESYLIPKIATGFCGGLGKTDSLCGALTGGVLCINIIAGCTEPNADRAENYELIQDLTDYFRDDIGALNCKDVCGYDLTTLTGQKEYEKSNTKSRCTEVVEKTTEKVLEILMEYNERKSIIENS